MSQPPGRPRRPKLTINIPNILTVFRILITPVFVIFLIRDEHGYALVLFAIAGISDGLEMGNNFKAALLAHAYHEFYYLNIGKNVARHTFVDVAGLGDLYVTADRNNPATCRLRELAAIGAEDLVLLAGSTQAPEEFLAVESYRTLYRRFPPLRLILVPRHTTRCDEIAAMLEQSGFSWQRRTELDQLGAKPEARILLVDTIGELGAWWGTASIAFVGGSLGSPGDKT